MKRVIAGEKNPFSAEESLAWLDQHVYPTLWNHSPLSWTLEHAKRQLGISWLLQQRPSGFWPRVAWTWRIVRALWGQS
jgi:hypothetical protein